MRDFRRGIAFLLGTVLLAATAGEAALADPGLPYSEEDIGRAFARRPGGSLDAIYRGNMLRLSEAFDRALAAAEAPADFSAWLAEQHRYAVLGEKPGTFYWPEVNQRRDGREIPSHIATAEAAAGIYRHQRRDQRPEEFLTQEVKLSAETLAAVAHGRAGDLGKPVSVGPGILLPYFFPVVEGLPAGAQPRYTLLANGGVKYDYPPARFVPDYVNEMDTSFRRIRGLMRASGSDYRPLLKELGRYYHLAMIGHPFLRVNNSLLMAQVNVALKRKGLRPVPHGDLDYIVRSLDSAAAAEAFTAHVLANQ